MRLPHSPRPPATVPAHDAWLVEPAVRRVAAERLGVQAHELERGVSLRDDLAADAWDLVELILALEAEFGIEIPDELAGRIRTYDELVRATGTLLGARWHRAARGTPPSPVAHVRFGRMRRRLPSSWPWRAGARGVEALAGASRAGHVLATIVGVDR